MVAWLIPAIMAAVQAVGTVAGSVMSKEQADAEDEKARQAARYNRRMSAFGTGKMPTPQKIPKRDNLNMGGLIQGLSGALSKAIGAVGAYSADDTPDLDAATDNGVHDVKGSPDSKWPSMWD